MENAEISPKHALVTKEAYKNPFDEKVKDTLNQVLGFYLSQEIVDRKVSDKEAYIHRRLPLYIDALKRGKEVVMDSLIVGLDFPLEGLGRKHYQLEKGRVRWRIMPNSNDPFEIIDFTKKCRTDGIITQGESGFWDDPYLLEKGLLEGLRIQRSYCYQFQTTLVAIRNVEQNASYARRWLVTPQRHFTRIKEIDQDLARRVMDSWTREDVFISRYVLPNHPSLFELENISQIASEALSLNNLFQREEEDVGYKDWRRDRHENTLVIELIANPDGFNKFADLASPFTTHQKVIAVENFMRRMKQELDPKTNTVIVIDFTTGQQQEISADQFDPEMLPIHYGYHLINQLDEALVFVANQVMDSARPNIERLLTERGLSVELGSEMIRRILLYKLKTLPSVPFKDSDTRYQKSNFFLAGLNSLYRFKKPVFIKRASRFDENSFIENVIKNLSFQRERFKSLAQSKKRHLLETIFQQAAFEPKYNYRDIVYKLFSEFKLIYNPQEKEFIAEEGSIEILKPSQTDLIEIIQKRLSKTPNPDQQLENIIYELIYKTELINFLNSYNFPKTHLKLIQHVESIRTSSLVREEDLLKYLNHLAEVTGFYIVYHTHSAQNTLFKDITLITDEVVGNMMVAGKLSTISLPYDEYDALENHRSLFLRIVNEKIAFYLGNFNNQILSKSFPDGKIDPQAIILKSLVKFKNDK